MLRPTKGVPHEAEQASRRRPRAGYRRRVLRPDPHGECVGERGRCPDVRGGSVLAQTAAGPHGAGIDHRRGRGFARPRVHRAPRQPHGTHRGRGRRGSADRGMLPGRPAGARVRSGRQSRRLLGRSLRRVRVAGLQPRDHRRPHGQRLDRRERTQRHACPQVLAHRRVPGFVRRAGGRPGRQPQRDALQPRRQAGLRRGSQRGLSRRRLRGTPRGGAGCLHRRLQALLGRLRQRAGRHAGRRPTIPTHH